MNSIFQAEDKDIIITVTDADGAAVDMSAATKLIVVLFQKTSDKQLQAYSLNAATGYSLLTISGPGNNVITLWATSVNTKAVADKEIYAAGKALIAGKIVEFLATVMQINKHPLAETTLP